MKIQINKFYLTIHSVPVKVIEITSNFVQCQNPDTDEKVQVKSEDLLYEIVPFYTGNRKRWTEKLNGV